MKTLVALLLVQSLHAAPMLRLGRGAPARNLTPAARLAPAVPAVALRSFAAPAPGALMPSLAAAPIASGFTGASAAAATAQKPDPDLGQVAAELDRLYSGTAGPEQVIAEGAYILPNERSTHLYAPVLKGRRGAIVSVGTFRGLHAAALGDFSHLVQVDYDRITTGFNRANLRLIARSQDRFDYIAALAGKDVGSSALADVRAGRISESDFLLRLNQARALAADEKDPAARLLHHPRVARRSVMNVSVVEMARRLANDPSDWRGSIFGSDAVFLKIQGLARTGRIIAVSGNLRGGTTFERLGDRLKKAGVQVSAVDVSNAMSYFRQGGLAAIARNVSALPLTPDAAMLFTILKESTTGDKRFSWDFRGAKAAISADSWLYLALPASRFLSDVVTLTSEAGYVRYVSRLAGRAF